ncbi:contractile injection system tape measure protein, partial [Methylomagnum sp.]
MANLRHSITRVVLELDIAQERQAEPVRKRVGDFCRASLGEVLEACLIEFGTGDTVFLFERVELELGPVAEDRLEDDLARKIRAALRRFLAEKLPRRWPEPSAEAVPAGLGGASELAPLHGLADYLARGVLPGATGAATHPDRLLIAAADATPEALARLLRELGQKAGIRKRIASHVSESTLHRLIRLLEPDHAGFIIDLARALAEWPGPGLANRRVLSRMAWEFVLAYLLVERGLEFNRRAFVESLARQVAGRLAVSYGELAGRLARAESGRPELDGAVLLEIAAAGKSAEPESVSPARRRLQVLESFLSGGVMPWPVGIDPGLGINRILDSLMDEAPDELLYLLRRLGYRDSVRKRLAFEFSGRVIERLVGLLEPGDAGLIVAYVRDVAEVQARRPVVQQENRGFRKTLWEFVLTFLLCERGSHFNARSFVKSTLLKMAARYRIAYGELLLGLIVRSDLLRAVASQRYSLPSILLSLADEFHVGLVTSSTPRLAGEEHSQAHANPAPNGSGSQPRPNPHPQGHDDLDLLAHWLANGRPPAWSRFADAGGLRHLLAGLRRQRPEELARLWFDLAHDPAVAARSDIAAVVREFADLPHIDDGGMKASFDHPHPSPSSTPLRTGLPEGEGAYNAPPFDAVATWAGEAGAARMEDSARATPAAADALERLLRYGLWPAAAREGSEAEWVAWLASLTDGAVLAALRRVGPLESAVKRLARRLPAAFYERVFDLLAGTGLVPACRTALEALAGEDAAYAGQVRAYLLAYLLSQEREQPGPPDAEDLLRRVLSALAIRYGQPYRRLLETLANTVRGGELEPMVAMLRREMRADAPTDGPVGAGFSPRPESR